MPEPMTAMRFTAQAPAARRVARIQDAAQRPEANEGGREEEESRFGIAARKPVRLRGKKGIMVQGLLGKTGAHCHAPMRLK